MSGRGVGAGSGASGKTFGQLEREVAELRRLVKELMQPKSRARVVNLPGESKPDISLRVNGLNFQVNYNRGDGWETWATGEECT